MTISIPKKTRATLFDTVREALLKSKVLSGSFIALDPTIWQLYEEIASGSPLDKRLQSILGGRHVSDFVRSEVARTPLGKWDMKAKPLPFELAFGSAKASELSETLIQRLESLPWRYHIYTELPGGFMAPLLEGTDLFELTPRLKLISGKRLAQELPIPSNALMLASPDGRKQWCAESLYAEVGIDGYVAKDLDSDTVQDASDLVFCFYGLCLALQLFETGHAWLNPRPADSYKASIYQTTDNNSNHLAEFEFDPSHAKGLHGFVRSTATLRAGPEEFKNRLHQLSHIMRNEDHRVHNAARWLFDSHCGSNAQVRFVQIATAFEVLLGDEKQARETGLSTLMANRCAYMLGRNETQRTNIYKGFKSAYDIRSRIVHAGKTKLSYDERSQLQYMQTLCATVIRKECEEFLTP